MAPGPGSLLATPHSHRPRHSYLELWALPRLPLALHVNHLQHVLWQGEQGERTRGHIVRDVKRSCHEEERGGLWTFTPIIPK